MSHNSYIPDEQHLRDKLQAFQPDFDEQAWTLFQKQLPVTPGTPVNPNNIHTATTTVRLMSAAVSLFTTINLYYTMLMLWMSVALSGHLERPAPPPASLPILAPRTLQTETRLPDHRMAPIASIPAPEKRRAPAAANAHIPAAQPGEPAFRQNAPEPKRAPLVAVAQANTGRFAIAGYKDDLVTTGQSIEYEIAGTQADAHHEVLNSHNDTLQEIIGKPLIGVSLPAATHYKLLQSNSVALTDSSSPFKTPWQTSGKRYAVGASILRGTTNGMLARAEFVRMLGTRFGIGAALLMAQYDQYNTYENSTNITNEYYVASTGFDVTMLYRTALARRIDFQTFGGVGLRSHLVGEAHYMLGTTEWRETHRYEKVGFDLGAQLLFRIKGNFQAGVQYVFYKDYLDDIPDRHFVGLTLQLKL